jgi:uncharacterized protein with PIN domain
MESGPSIRFACDAMLGSLARWLRAAGYDAFWQEGIDDWDLVRLALREGWTLLTSDTGIFRIGCVRDGELPSLFIPPGMDREGQLAFVLRELNLSVREPRCMACGGELAEVPRAEVRDRVPPASFARQEHFYQCERCGRVLWQGTHWQRIAGVLERVRGPGTRQPGLRTELL